MPHQSQSKAEFPDEELLVKDPWEWKAIEDEVEALIQYGNVERAARLLRISHTETVTKDDVWQKMRHQSNLHVWNLTGISDLGRLDDDEFEIVLQEYDRQRYLLRYPDIPSNATLEDLQERERVEKVQQLGLRDKANFNEIREEESRLERIAIAEKLELFHLHPSYSSIIRRLLNLPLTASREQIAERFQTLWPALQEVVSRETADIPESFESKENDDSLRSHH